MSATSRLVALARDPQASPMALGRAMDEATNREWRDWLPETISAFCSLGANDVQQRDKLMAVQVVLTNPDVADNWALFSGVVSAFNHRRSSFEWIDKPSLLELAWAVHCIERLNPRTFGPGVLAFIQGVMLDDGLLVFPWSSPRIEVDVEPVARATLLQMWDAGMSEATGDDAIDNEDLVHAQAAKLVACQDFIRANERLCAA